MKLQKPFSIALAALAVSATVSSAQTFQYATSDLLMGFQQAGGAAEALVDLGPITTYSTQPAGTTVTVPLPATLLGDAFTGFNNVRFSAFADVNLNVLASPYGTNYPPATLWTTKPRISLGTVTAPWPLSSGSKQGVMRSDIEGFSVDAVKFANTPAIAPPAGPDNNASGVLLPVGDPVYSYDTFVGPIGDINGAWYGNTERSMANTAPVGRADLYESVPNFASKYLGYFQFYTNGIMTYTSGTLTIPQTTVSNIVRSVNTSTITYGPTIPGAAYSLVSTNNLTGNPVSTWPAILSSAQPGTGSGETSKATATDAARFYNVLAQ